MKILLPVAFEGRELTDRQLVFAELVYRMRNLFGSYHYYRMYANDVKIILGNQDVFSPERFRPPFEGLIDFIDVDSRTWYIKPVWNAKLGKAIPFELSDDKAIKTYCYLLGRTVNDRFEDKRSKVFDTYLVDGRKGVQQQRGLDLQQLKEFLWPMI